VVPTAVSRITGGEWRRRDLQAFDESVDGKGVSTKADFTGIIWLISCFFIIGVGLRSN
jgi:hypothetical protein